MSDQFLKRTFSVCGRLVTCADVTSDPVARLAERGYRRVETGYWIAPDGWRHLTYGQALADLDVVEDQR